MAANPGNRPLSGATGRGTGDADVHTCLRKRFQRRWYELTPEARSRSRDEVPAIDCHG